MIMIIVGLLTHMQVVWHGRGNYVAALKYINELSFKYLENESKVDDSSFINNYFNKCNYLTCRGTRKNSCS